MAIIVRERKATFNWFNLTIWVLVIALIFALVYFLFFKQPEWVEILKPTGSEKATELAKIRFDPDAVIQSEVFKSLQQYSAPPTTGEVGRLNPFVPF